jgi:Flp pilus assembly pilin Flp
VLAGWGGRRYALALRAQPNNRLSAWYARRAGALRRRAQDTVEYGLLVATVALVALIGALTFGPTLERWLELLAGRIATVGT